MYIRKRWRVLESSTKSYFDQLPRCVENQESDQLETFKLLCIRYWASTFVARARLAKVISRYVQPCPVPHLTASEMVFGLQVGSTDKAVRSSLLHGM
jgi:hypothetical protein